jgi:hypothetical protein
MHIGIIKKKIFVSFLFLGALSSFLLVAVWFFYGSISYLSEAISNMAFKMFSSLLEFFFYQFSVLALFSAFSLL